MSIVQTNLQVLPAANDATSFYVAMQPFTSGKTYEVFVSPNLVFNPNTNQFTLNGKPISKNQVITSTTAPLNPSVGDLWYDSSTDITFQYSFDGQNYNWIDISSPCVPTNFIYGYVAPAGSSAPVPTSYTVNYLIVGGGQTGGAASPAGYVGGGGGAGGLIAGSTSLTINNTYTITVAGAGGFSLLSTIANVPTGGTGGVYPSNVGGAGATGGGGSSGANPYPNAGLASGSPGVGVAGTYGYPGGAGNTPAGAAVGGGGGGAGSAGGTALSGPVYAGGPGGNGYTWPYTANTYAGGGGGGGYSLASQPAGTGGPGGGAPGVASSAPNTVNGTQNTGGGGGAGGYGPGGAGAASLGGSGIIILAVPTPNYPGAYGPIATTPPAAPGMTVLTFTTSSTYTA